MTSLTERFATHTAGERSLSAVCPRVLCEKKVTGEPLLALWTFVSSLSSVHLEMSVQITLEAVRFVTL